MLRWLFLCAFLRHNLALANVSLLAANNMKAIDWIKRLGFWGFLFFLVKGLLWLLVPALVAIWAN